MARLDRIPGLTGQIARTRRRLRDIAIWKAFGPLIALATIYLIAALVGIFERAPKQIAALATLIVLVGLIVALMRGFARYRKPTRQDAITVLDAQDELRPIQSLSDRPARPNAGNVALWKAHEQRLTDAARRLHVPWFRKQWRAIDPAFLRFALPAGLIGLALLNGPQQVHQRLASALMPDYGSLLGAERIQIEAWLTPPAYSGRAPIFLGEEQGEARVPKGAVMTLRVQAPSTPKLRVANGETRRTISFEATPDGAYEIEVPIETDARISVRWWGERKAWTIFASPDDVPRVAFVEVPILGQNDHTEFTWSVSDDYGVERLDFSIRPEGEDREPDLVEIEMGAVSPKEASDDAEIDFTRNRWAGARVEVRLVATDGAGQVGYSEPHVFVLPEKLLLQPLAKAVQDIRVTILREDAPYEDSPPGEDALTAGAYFVSATQRLARAPDGVQRGAVMLEAVTYQAPLYFKDILVYTGLRAAQHELTVADSTQQAKQVEPLLWSVVLRAEYGTAADALSALLAARKALEEALRDGASEEEIARLMEAFKNAAQRYVAAKMAEALANGMEAPPDDTDSAQQGGGPSLGGQDFSDMLDALQDLTETGSTEQARQLLADITNMLENLEFQQGSGQGDGFPGMPGEPGESDEDLPQEEREMTETMRELSDLLRQQRELNDETLAQQRGERRQPEGAETPEGEGGEGFDPDAPDWMREGGDGRSLAERQDELGNMVEELARRNGEGGDSVDSGEEGEGTGGGLLDEELLESIERAQRRASRALEDGNELRALRNQEQATRQLRELAEGLAEALDAAREERVGDDDIRRAAEQAADPFGNSSTGGIDDSNSVDVPDEAERQRAKDILDELRQRYGDTLDEDEREYLERLLDRF